MTIAKRIVTSAMALMLMVGGAAATAPIINDVAGNSIVAEAVTLTNNGLGKINLSFTNLTDRTVKLNWNWGGAGTNRYHIYLVKESGVNGKYVHKYTTSSTSYIVRGLKPNTTYTFAVRGWSKDSKKYTNLPDITFTTKKGDISKCTVGAYKVNSSDSSFTKYYISAVIDPDGNVVGKSNYTVTRDFMFDEMVTIKGKGKYTGTLEVNLSKIVKY